MIVEYENIKFVQDGPVVTLTLCRPEALNALNSQTLIELGQALSSIGAEVTEGVRAVILTGEGKAFVAGADISELVGLSRTQAEYFSRRGQAVFAALEALPVPVIAAVNGFALGGGCELALACDFIYAGERAKFGQPEVNLGVIPGFGGTQRLTRLVGRAAASELIYSGRIIGAQEALRLGLVARVVPQDELLDAAMATALEIASKAPLAIAAAKILLMDGADMALERANSMEATAFGAVFATEDQTEGMQAFLEKRKPNFKGA
jgi:enoyl-CoA hydratase